MTYPNSSAVVPGDPTAAAHYNNLRSDSLYLGQAAADAVALAALLERYESRLLIERLSTDKVRVPASASAPVSLMVDGYMVQAVAAVDLADDDRPAGGADDYYIFANRAAASTTFTLTVDTSPTELDNQRRIGRFYWDGTKIIKDSVRTEQSLDIKSMLYYQDPQICDGRLTASTGVPITYSDINSSNSLYFTPYIGNRVSLYVPGYGWRVYTFTELVIDVTALGNNKQYDVWIYDDAGTIKLATTEWSSDTLRATALVYQNGVPVKSGSPEYRYLGSFRTLAGPVAIDSRWKRFIWNYYNQVPRSLYRHDATESWTYATRAWRGWNNNVNNFVSFICGLENALVVVDFLASGKTSAGGQFGVGIGLDSYAAAAADSAWCGLTGTSIANLRARYQGFPGLGLHYLAMLEYGDATATFYGLFNSTIDVIKSSLFGYIFA